MVTYPMTVDPKVEPIELAPWITPELADASA